MALLSKVSSTITARKDPEAYINDVDADLKTLFRALRFVPSVTQGIVAPTSTPRQVGDIYVDTLLKDVYIAVGNSSSSDWELMN